MYFCNQLSIDPSQLTQLERRKPTKAFGRFFYYLTAGLGGEKTEVETFTAVSVLQQINMAMRSVGVTNLVRLAKDGTDFYYDREGRPDDLQHAVAAFEHAEASPFGKEVFERLAMVLEHHDETFKYLIQIDILRVHAPGTYPITVTINGVPNELHTGGADKQTLEQRMRPIFADQAAHDGYVSRLQAHFDGFAQRVKDAIAGHMHIDDVMMQPQRKLVRPGRRRNEVGDVAYDASWEGHSDPIFGGYHGFADAFFYAWLWSELTYEHNLRVHDVSLVDECGRGVLDVGPSGFEAASCSALDPNATFEPPASSEDIVWHGDNDYAACFPDDIKTASWTSGDLDTDGSWIDSFSFDVGGGSSCGSSCGGGCGGCGGGCGT